MLASFREKPFSAAGWIRATEHSLLPLDRYVICGHGIRSAEKKAHPPLDEGYAWRSIMATECVETKLVKVALGGDQGCLSQACLTSSRVSSGLCRKGFSEKDSQQE